MYKHILIPTDGSALSNEALVRSLQLAKTFGAAVTILTVEEPFHVFSMGSAQLAASLNDYQDQIRAQAERLLNDAAAQARELGLSRDLAGLARRPVSGHHRRRRRAAAT